MKTLMKQRCTQCGDLYGAAVVELTKELVDAQLVESHGYCPLCALTMQQELDAELRAMGIEPEEWT